MKFGEWIENQGLGSKVVEGYVARMLPEDTEVVMGVVHVLWEDTDKEIARVIWILTDRLIIRGLMTVTAKEQHLADIKVEFEPYSLSKLVRVKRNATATYDSHWVRLAGNRATWAVEFETPADIEQLELPAYPSNFQLDDTVLADYDRLGRALWNLQR